MSNFLDKNKEKKLPSITFGRISSREKLFFVKHLSTMIKAGLTLGEALEVLEDQAQGRFKRVLFDILNFVRRGNTLSAGLARYPNIFSPIFINLIEAGEASGTLEQNLEYLSLQLKKSDELQKKVKGAMMYPILILVATVGISLGLAFLVLPKITKIFKSLEIELPLLTRILLAFADFLNKYSWQILVGLILVGLFLSWLSRQKFVRPFSHRFLLLLPIISPIVRQVQLARFSLVLGTLIKSGLPIDRSLTIAKEVTDNIVYQRIIERLLVSVRRGATISETLAFFERDFPKIFSRMISVGEKTGELDSSLLYLADFYEAEVKDTTENLTDILEPVLLIIIGIMVGTVALSIISPIYQLTGSLKVHP